MQTFYSGNYAVEKTTVRVKKFHISFIVLENVCHIAVVQMITESSTWHQQTNNVSLEFITLIKFLSYNIICKDLYGILVNQFCVIKSHSACYCEMPPNIAL